MVKEEFKRGASIPVEPFPADSTAVADSPRLSLVVLDPDCEWDGGPAMRDQIAEWTKNRGKSSRLYPGALVWCLRKPGRDLREKVETLLAWRRVQKDVRDGVLGTDFEKADLQEIAVQGEGRRRGGQGRSVGRLPLRRAGRQLRSERAARSSTWALGTPARPKRFAAGSSPR